jgi:hypothetical protein
LQTAARSKSPDERSRNQEKRIYRKRHPVAWQSELGRRILHQDDHAHPDTNAHGSAVEARSAFDVHREFLGSIEGTVPRTLAYMPTSFAGILSMLRRGGRYAVDGF